MIVTQSRCYEWLSLVANDRDPDGSVANDLIACFRKELPLNELLPLVRSPLDSVAASGCFIAAELRDKVLPILPELADCSNHRSHVVRCDVIQIIEVCGTKSGGTPMDFKIGHALVDSHPSVRWFAVQTLSRIPVGRASIAVRGLRSQSQSEVTFATEIPNAIDETRHRLMATDFIQLSLGLVAAIRMRETDPTLLQLAVASSDHRISSIASDAIDW